MHTLVHCIYASTATESFDQGRLLSLLDQARKANDAAGLTGMLLHSRGSFFQVLEGRQAAVEAVFGRIAADPRHRGVTQIILEPVALRAFADWTMGFADVTEKELADIAGTNDYFDRALCLAKLDNGRARKLLDAFAKGRWRAKVTNDSPANVATRV